MGNCASNTSLNISRSAHASLAEFGPLEGPRSSNELPRATSNTGVDPVVNPAMADKIRQSGAQTEVLSAPIHHLPPEILLAIFRFTAANRDHEDSIKILASLLAVSRVWRRLALGCFELWTRLDARFRMRIFKLFLDRSGDAPLEFHCNFAPSYDSSRHISSSRRLSALLPHRNRLIACHLRGGQLWEALSLLAEASPALEVLSLARTDVPYDKDFYWHANTYIPAVAQRYLAHAPRLRELTLDNSYLPLWPHTPPHLIKLTLCSISYELPGTFPLLFRALEATPLLEEFNLHLISTKHLRTIPPPAEIPIQLPNLRIMRIHGLFPHKLSACVLSSIIAPPFLSLTCGAEYEVMLSSLLPRWSTAQPNLPGFARICDVNVATNFHDCWAKPTSITITALSDRYDTPLLRVEFTDYIGGRLHDVLPSIMEGLLLCLPEMPFLTTLSLSNYLPPGPSSPAQKSNAGPLFAEFFARHPQIEELTLTELREPWVEVLAVTPHRHLCPRLRKLTLVRCPIASQTLMDIVSPRAKGSGGYLEEVSLRDCSDVDETTECGSGSLWIEWNHSESLCGSG